MPSLSVCVPIFNNVNNFKALYRSIVANTHQRDLEFILYNDGSTKPGIDADARSFCASNGIRYISAKTNRGVASSWNELCRAATSGIVVLLNDDLLCGPEDWAQQIIFAFSQNERLGIVYWCQRLIDPATGSHQLTADSVAPMERGIPVLRHNFCGAFFAFRKSLWQDIKQPDDSVGFWEDTQAYGEEFDFSAEAHARGLFILQLPIIWEHLHSQTFQSNSSARTRGDYSSFLPQREFEASFGIKRNPIKTAIRSILKSPQPPTINKLEYSLAMVEKKWAIRTILGVPGRDFIKRMQMDGYPEALRLAVERDVSILPGTISVPERGRMKATDLLDFHETSLA